MRNSNFRNGVVHFTLLSITFVLSIVSVSNLMSLLLTAATGRITFTSELLAAGYSVAAIVAIVVLARAIYRVDKQAGRIRNRVGWFE